jgi:hypothetical protein
VRIPCSRRRKLPKISECGSWESIAPEGGGENVLGVTLNLLLFEKGGEPLFNTLWC